MDEEQLKNMRHSCAHLLAAAVQHLWPDVKLGVGPVIEDGFYYDVDMEHRLSEEDFTAIEQTMRSIASRGFGYEREDVPMKEAKARAKALQQPYKLELIEQIEKTGSSATVSAGDTRSVIHSASVTGRVKAVRADTVSFYTTGDFVDLCRGGHVRNTKEIGPFKLLSVAGAYWRGNETNPMLQRIYGTCWETQAELDAYLARIEEAKKRDHKKLGRELDLFLIDEKVGQGLPLWTPKGTAIKFALEAFTRALERQYGYEHVSTPYLGSEELYRTSGHLDHYTASMYAPIDMDGDKFYLRPMACPHHIRMYQRKQWSYQELPVRYAEIADYNRYEKSGELMGMIRVRKFQLTDGHLFVTPDGLKEEFKNVCRMIRDAMQGLGLGEIAAYRFSLRDPNNKEKYFPDDALWDKAEGLMKQALDELKLPYVEVKDEAAFYGPKLDVQARNVNGKEDTLFTAQIDFLLPEKFEIEYSDATGAKQRPVMIHRSTIGSLERTLGFLIEHYAGKFPFWLAPVQIKLIPIADRHTDAADRIATVLRQTGYRVEVDRRSESMGKKIRTAQLEQVPYMLVLGDRELEAKQVAVRHRDDGDLGTMSQDELMAKLKSESTPL
ncbi:threonine--tRNA ligase [Candidatus Berkelbacteria bacterium]|nr:threonine--tRNA ligase [Candidatus Berkelbacteria bacterium]